MFPKNSRLNKAATKRLRVFAGPNGSGKSTLAKDLRKKHPIGVFVNADEIEKKFNERGSLSLYKYEFSTSTKPLRAFMKKSGMARSKMGDETLHLKFKVTRNNIFFSGVMNSYIAADIAAFIRYKLLIKGKSFSFETVFSHESKLEIMKEARRLGYRVYFYFLTTDDPDINVNRVKIRVAQSGHDVEEKKIRDRYFKSLNLMLDAVRLSSRAYLFDNSGQYYRMVSQIDNGKSVQTFMETPPSWFSTYLYKKSK